MSRYSLNPDRLFDRPWRMGHPFRPKTGRFRRLFMLVLLIILLLVIWGYGFVTDPRRVRRMAEQYLSELVGGRVTVAQASLSIFEGLRLDGVRVYTQAPSSGGVRVTGIDDAPDALVFSARTFIVRYEPRSILEGKLRATRIIAERPQVHLSRDVRSGNWNFQRLGQREPVPAAAPSAPAGPSALPELLLRNARVEIAELRDGRYSTLGHMSIDGQLTPEMTDERIGHDRFRFTLQSRGLSDDLGPLVTGMVHLAGGRVSAEMRDFEFGRDVRAMLPEEVRRWWERHELAGRIDVPVLDYTPAQGDKPPVFRIRTVLNGVNLTIPPEEWMTRQEVVRRESARRAVRSMRSVMSAAGLTAERAALPATMPGGPPVLASADRLSADRTLDMLGTVPIELRQVSGAFEFTEKGVKVERLAGRVENNLLEIDGEIHGYDPESPMQVHLRSGRAEDLTVPAAPRYVWSLPREVRQLYEDIRPQGTCRLGLSVSRPEAAGPVSVLGFVDLVDAQFRVNDFPYPFRQTTGRLELAKSPDGQTWLMLRGLHALGAEQGQNKQKKILVEGWVGPLGLPDGRDPGGLIQIRADDIVSDTTLLTSLPNDVQEALALFDAPGKGEFPRFRGNVLCEVYKDIGGTGPFKVRVDVDVKDMDGQFVEFPYPMRKASGLVKVREGYCELVNVRIPHPTATVMVDGRVAWPMPPNSKAPKGRKTELKVTVRDLPVDGDLLASLPKDQADWIVQLGLKGKIDVDGLLKGAPIVSSVRDPSPLDYSLDIRLKDGSLRPGGKSFEVAGVAGRIHLTPRELELLELTGRHGDSPMSAIGRVQFAGAVPRIMLVASGEKLPFDKALYEILPPDAQAAWDEVRPQGSIDAEVTFAAPIDSKGNTILPRRRAGGGVTVVDLSPTAQSTQPTALVLELPASGNRAAVQRELPVGLHGLLKPRDAVANLKTVPYTLDHVNGEVAITPEKVELRKISARHGSASLSISGTGWTGDRPTWELAIGAKDVPADAELRAALPPSVSSLLTTLQLAGTIDFSLDRFVYRSASTVDSTPREPELDLAGSIALRGSDLDIGVPLKKVAGVVTLKNVTVRNGRLDELVGRIDADSLDLSDREVIKLGVDLVKPSGRAELGLMNLRAGIGGGDVAGQATLSIPEDGPGRYGLTLQLRNADVRDLAKETGDDIRGLVTASLALEGTWGKNALRRGRGDVIVSGKELYRIPVLLGLLQVTNLSLPISSPFNTGVARYSLEGEKLTFEKIELRSNAILMAGEGTLDFGTKQVRMTFVTDNPGAFKIPFLQDLWRGAQQELLRIHVRGTVQEPKVQASSFGTITTTVDEVFRGDDPKRKK